MSKARVKALLIFLLLIGTYTQNILVPDLFLQYATIEQVH